MKNKYPILTGLFVLLLVQILFSRELSAQEKPVHVSVLIEEVVNEKGIDEAIYEFQRLKKTASEQYDFSERPLFRLGYSVIQKKDYKGGLKFLNFLIQEYPESIYGYNYLALTYFQIAHSETGDGDSQKAKTIFEKVLKLDPENTYARFYLEKIYVVQNYTKEVFDIKMRDGKHLLTIVYSPNDKSSKYPILLNRRPYGLGIYDTEKRGYMNVPGPSSAFNKEKYIFVIQDVRGRFMSEGEFVHVRPIREDRNSKIDTDESTDTFDTIDWLVKNIPGNNGKAAIWGTSYMGFYAALALIDPHPALSFSTPAAPIADWFLGDDPRRNGALYYFHAVNFFNTQGIERTELSPDYPDGLFEDDYQNVYDFFLDIGPIQNVNDKLFKGNNKIWNQILEHNTYDDFWKQRSTLPQLKGLTTPVMTIGGWYDAEDLFGTFKTYQTIEKNNPDIPNTIVIGPWYHGGWSEDDDKFLGDIKLNNGEAAKYFREKIELPLFNYYLKGGAKIELPEALVYETGTNIWREYNSWPPENSKTKNLYFRENHGLSFSSAKRNKTMHFDEFISDPAHPVPFIGEVVEEWDYEFMHADQRFASEREDVLNYSTELLTENLTVVGPMKATLFVETDKTDADWVIKIIDVFPDVAEYESPNEDVDMGGYQMLVRHDIMRGKFRDSFEKTIPFEPNTVTKVEFEILDINHSFKAGHKLMIQVQSSMFPLYDRNPQKYMDISKATENDYQTAKHKLYHSNKYPSRIQIRVMENEAK